MSAAHDDRREFSRVPIPLEGRLVMDQGQSMLGHLIDLSVGGVLFAADQPLAEGTPVRIEVLCNGSHSQALVRAEGRLGRKSAEGTAIAFTHMDVESFDALRDLVLAHADDPERVMREFREHLGLRLRDPL